MKVLTPGFLSLALGAAVAVGAAADDPQTCEPSPMIRAFAPQDQGADSISGEWYVNADRTIWAGPVPGGGWPAGGTVYSGHGPVKGLKTYWVRPKGTKLAITGRRLDAEGAPSVEAHIPCCYPSGFQIVGLHFPSEGCWEVNARSGSHELRFVTHVQPARPPAKR